jgi:hypothetical protein
MKYSRQIRNRLMLQQVFIRRNAVSYSHLAIGSRSWPNSIHFVLLRIRIILPTAMPLL